MCAIQVFVNSSHESIDVVRVNLDLVLTSITAAIVASVDRYVIFTAACARTMFTLPMKFSQSFHSLLRVDA